MKLCLKHLRTVLLGPSQEDACPIVTGGGGGVQCIRSDGEGEQTSGIREHIPPRATGVLLLSGKEGQGLAEQG